MRLPQRCLFCGNGQYTPLVALPSSSQRKENSSIQNPRDIYGDMRGRARFCFGHGDGGGVGSVGPLFLICQYCGNVQEFRFDLAREAVNNWKP
jgi:hypothetical protein